MASIIRDISPPEAIFVTGRNSSPIFVEIKNSHVSIPDSIIFSGSEFNCILKFVSDMFRCLRLSFIVFSNFIPVLLRYFEIVLEHSSNSVFNCCTSFTNKLISALHPPDSISV